MGVLKFCALLLVFFMAGCSLSSKNVSTIDLMDATVLVNLCGSGVVVEAKQIRDSRLDEIFILTAAHVTGSSGFCFISIFEHNSFAGFGKFVKLFSAEIIAEDKETDVALLRSIVPKGLVKPVKIVDRIVVLIPGEKLVSVGCGDANLPMLTEGIFGRWIGLDPAQGLYTGGVTHGNSGGGIYTADGVLVGLTIGMLKLGTHPIWHISSFVFVSQETIDDLKRRRLHMKPKAPKSEPKLTKTKA